MGLKLRSGSDAPALLPLLKQLVSGQAGHAQLQPVNTRARPEISAGV